MPLMRTTTVAVTAPIDPRPLDARLTLVRYDLPARLKFMMDNSPRAKIFERVHVIIRSQIRQPYYFYTHDRLGSSDYAIYVLYANPDAIRELAMPLLDLEQLPRRVVSFGDIPHHLTLKLLQAQYFGEEESTRFTSQGKHFLLARLDASRFIGLEVEIKGAKANREDGSPQIYHTLGRATRFIRVKPEDLDSYQISTQEYVQLLSPRDGLNILSVLPPREVRTCPNPVFRIYRERNSRPTLDYHAQRNYQQTRGYLLSAFIASFTAYLAGFGIDATQEERDFAPHRIDAKQIGLRTPPGTVVCLLDHRLNQRDVPFATYQDWLVQTFPQIRFAPITALREAERRPTLILLDVAADAFEEGNILAGEPDPYQELYQASETASWPKQSICVNPNDVESAVSRDTYLTYPPCDFSAGSGFALRFQVSLNQLMLKDLILNNAPVAERLPFMAPTTTDAASLAPFVFVRRQTYRGTSYPVLLSVADGCAQFLDLRSPKDKERRDELLARLGLDWNRDVIGPWQAKYRMAKGEDDSKTPYHFILGQGLVVEVEDCQEHVLYEYDLIAARQAAIDEPLPIQELKLAPHYDILRRKDMLSLAQLTSSTPSDRRGAIRPERLEQSAAFYEQLQQVDAFLDELGAHVRGISFTSLTGGENGLRLDAILFPEGTSEEGGEGEEPVTGEPARVRRRLKRLYQRQRMFLSDKGADVQYYRGIWVDREGRFMVGSPEQMKFEQARAHLIRRFHAYVGREGFPITLFLNTLGVLFVRPEQYTVYPYPFHLIDQYVKARLHWGPADER